MFAAFGQFASTSQFYLYGRNHCTKTGWEKASKAYPKPDILEKGRESDVDLSGKVFMLTGANSGIGKEIASFLAIKKATVYMVCRSAERGNAAREEIVRDSSNDNVHLLLGDCSLERDVRRLWSEFESHQKQAYPDKPITLDGLICNAGALLNEKTVTDEGVEITFAGHLLFGTYLLGTLAMPTLQATPSSRLIVVSSGGMYNSKFPKWEIATSTGTAKYDGQFAYVYAKRGQVLLCEEWAKQFGDSVKVVSCHPGWVGTPGVDSAYGENKRYLEPLRNMWEGSEGIVWLCIAPVDQIEGGAYYLDRSPQVKHLAGAFFTEGSYTKNTPDEVQEMMTKLQEWSSGHRPTHEQSMAALTLRQPLQASTSPIELAAFMGDWNVLANIPTTFEVGATNCIEKYVLDENRPNTVKVEFESSSGSTTRAGVEKFSTSHMKMRGNVKNSPTNTFWGIDPKMLGIAFPLGMSYLILDCADDYSYTMVGVPDRSYLWIMIRSTPSEFKEVCVKVTQAYPELMQESAEGKEENVTSSTQKNGGSYAAVVAAGAGAIPPSPEEEVMSASALTSAASATDSSSAPAVASDVPTASVPSVVADSAEPSAASANADTCLAPPSDAVSELDMDGRAQALKREAEIKILRKALSKAAELGYDTSKILRCPWRNELPTGK
eukprot:CAMPEP_0170397230 /NCGR_PEP_ID=MMETSP0117_2-20130122/22763_1 /TAXON_ID=400756 /ORGANISM="Durinskia baltica, Strain CSIRO CS-38" /LENGTH=663 /DNA_ID=CAMNT_0010653717 /DNA_START=180 /DNA_END=2171 /DNA_ORIENTATION=-